MFISSIPAISVWANAAVFGFAGIVNVTALGAVRRAYKRWDIPAGFYRSLGVLEIIAAWCLVAPSLRHWGVALAAPIMFGAVVMLLHHRKYRYAICAILVMAALVPAASSIPQSRFQIRYATELDSARPARMAIATQLANEPARAGVRESQIVEK
jgi:DoxX-like family